jgi:ketosteroid isomerase-like protein
MRRYLLFVIVGIICSGLMSCQSGRGGLSKQDEAAIREHDADWVKIMNSGKPDWNAAVDAYYADDAKVLWPNAPAAVGRPAIKNAVAQFPPLKEFKWDVISLEGQGDLAYVHGTYEMTMVPAGASTPVTDKGKGIEVFKKQADGTWKVIRDIWNSDQAGLVVPAGVLKPDAVPELKQLAWLVGQWKLEGDAKASPMSPAGKYAVTMTCQWFPGGAQLVCGTEGTGPTGAFQELSLYGYDTGAKAYTMFDISSAGFNGSGKGSFQDGKYIYLFDTRAGGKPLRLRFTLFDTSASACKWKDEVSLAGGPWALADEGKGTKLH